MARKKAAKKATGSRVSTRKAAAKKRSKKPATARSKRSAAAKRAPSRKSKRSSSRKVPGVRVRMYRQGLGDCFLLTFHLGVKSKERHVLIDCGTLGNKTTKTDIRDDVVKNIEETTGGKLDLLIITHEHLDHLSAFRYSGGKRFKEKIKVAHVWQAWTENPADDDARKIAKKKGDLFATLAGLVGAPGIETASPEVIDLLGFFGLKVGGSQAGPLAASGTLAKTVDKAMKFVREELDAEVKFVEREQAPLAVDWLPGFRIYVLGPPRDDRFLGETGAHGSEHLYGIDVISDQLRANIGVALQGPAAVARSLRQRQEAHQPFDERFMMPSATVGAFYPDYIDPESGWRCIDHDYLQFGSRLALQLDNLTNNTSVALAIERMADGKVLLLPADAQEGSWLSWHEGHWIVPDEGNDELATTVAMKDLLARTVFYKVGHHGSHNATIKGKGLELMTRKDELTAFVPVDRAVALGRNPKDSWQMPSVELYRRLLEKCQGRVLRSDIGWAADVPNDAGNKVEGAFSNIGTSAEWKAWRKHQKAAEQSERITADSDGHFFDFVM